MSPGRHLARDGLLEHPDEAFADYANGGVDRGGVRGEAHGLAGRAADLPGRRGGRARFGVTGGETGAVYTRTGRAFFDPDAHRGAARPAARRRRRRPGCGDELDTDWLLLDAELLPWSVKAEALLREQYASVGAAAHAALPAASTVLARGVGRGLDVGRAARPHRIDPGWATPRRSREPTAGTAGRPTGWTACSWPPFQILAAEGVVLRRSATTAGTWRSPTAWSAADPRPVRATRRLMVDLADADVGGRRDAVVGGTDRRRW